MMHKLLLSGIVATSLLVTSAGQASDLLNPSFSNVITQGIITVSGGATVPWTGEFYAEEAQCLRIVVTAQSADMLMVAVDTESHVYRDDNSNGSGRPLLRIRAKRSGWYSVQVAQRQGQAISANFILQAQQLPSNDPSCLPATPWLDGPDATQ